MLRLSKKFIAGVCISAALFTSATVNAAPAKENKHVWKPKIKSVSVFKNGYGFYMRQGEVNLNKGWCLSQTIPPASFGTLAIFSQNQNHLVDIVGASDRQIFQFDGKDQPDTLQARKDKLNANMNLQVQLDYKEGERVLSAAGKLTSISEKFAILKNYQGNNIAVPVKDLKTMSILGMPLRIHVNSAKEKTPTPKKTDLAMVYLQKGITWVPEYTLRVIDEDTAELTLRGTLINNAEDLINCDVNFVVGVPNFAHKNMRAPIATGRLIRHIGAGVLNGRNKQIVANQAAFTNAISQNATLNSLGLNNVEKKKYNYKLPQKGTREITYVNNNAASSDFTSYTKKGLTLRTGEKAIVTLFKIRIKYTDVYEWNVPGKIIHKLKLQNNTKTGWTTGPCLGISGNQPLSEDVLKYTPAGADGELTVTTAINFRKTITETVADRKLKAYTRKTDSNKYSYSLDLVTLKGKIKLQNFGKKPIHIKITKSVTGKLTVANEDGSIYQDTENLQLLRQRGSVSWTVTIKPGESKTLEYTYERYVPSA